MRRKLVLLVLAAGPLFALAAFRQTAPTTLADVVRDEPSAVLHRVTAAAKTYSDDQCRQPANANRGGVVITNPASELSPRTNHTRKGTAKGEGFIRASVGNVRLNESGFIDGLAGAAGSAAFAASGIPGVPGRVSLAARTVAAAGVLGSVSIFWRLPTAILSSTAAAAAIAWISLGDARFQT
jgi:hypothetical protein